MAEDSYPNTPHNARALTEAEFEKLVSPVQPSGLVGTPALTALVYADSSGRQVKIRADREGGVRGFHWVSGGTEVTKAIAANTSGSPRIDLVVLRLTRATWQITVEIIAGTPATVPIAPTVTQTTTSVGVYEIPLAEVQVPDGAVTTTAGQVTPRAWYVSEGGHILCTVSTRPALTPSMIIWEYDTGNVLVGAVAGWKTVYADSGVVTVTPAVNWNAGVGTGLSAQLRSGVAYLSVDMRRVTSALASGATSTLGVLTSAYWPPTRKHLTAWSQGESPVRLEIATNGVISVSNSNGIAVGEYIATTGSWVVG